MLISTKHATRQLIMLQNSHPIPSPVVLSLWPQPPPPKLNFCIGLNLLALAWLKGQSCGISLSVGLTTQAKILTWAWISASMCGLSFQSLVSHCCYVVVSHASCSQKWSFTLISTPLAFQAYSHTPLWLVCTILAGGYWVSTVSRVRVRVSVRRGASTKVHHMLFKI